MERRDFVKQVLVAGTLSAIGGDFVKASVIQEKRMGNIDKQKIWAALVHLSFNMWEDHNRFVGDSNINLHWRGFESKLRFSDPMWRDILMTMKNEGLNMVLIDVGDGVKLNSCGEIAVGNAWSISKLKSELDYIRSLGLEPIPKFNFSASHDAWFGLYGRMLSTPVYYEACKRLIAEVIDLFDRPRFFHLGFDEEVYGHQTRYDYAVVRQNDLWWKDLLFLVNEVEKGGARAWIWSDYFWKHEGEFLNKMPKNVVQSNWYYKEDFKDTSNFQVQAYLKLAEAGFDQIPTSGYYQSDLNTMTSPLGINNTVEFCKDNLNTKQLLGFMQTNWRPTIEEHRQDIVKSIELIGAAKRRFY